MTGSDGSQRTEATKKSRRSRAADRRLSGFKKKSRLRRLLVSLGLSLAAALAFALTYALEDVIALPVLSHVEARLTDLRFRLRGPRAPSGEVAVVAIDTKSIAEIGRWPWSRSQHARLIDRLRQWGASTVVFDVIFSEPEGGLEAEQLRRIEEALPADAVGARDELSAVRREVLVDLQFVAAQMRTFADDAALTVLAFDFILTEDVERTRLLGRAVGPAEERAILDLASFMSRDQNLRYLRRPSPNLAIGIQPVIAELANASAAMGFVDPIYDVDGVIRRERLMLVYCPGLQQAIEEQRDPSQVLRDPRQRVQAMMPLAVAGVQTHLRLALDQVVLDLESHELRFPAGGEEKVIRFDGEDGTMQIDYYGGSGKIPTYSYADVLRGELTDAEGRPVDGSGALGGKLVFVGMSDPGIERDTFVTPFTANLAGVEKHATVADNLLHGRRLRRHSDPDLVVFLSALAAAVVAALLVSQLSGAWAAVALPTAALGWLIFTYRDFASGGVMWNLTVPLATLTVSWGLVSVYRQVKDQRVRRVMEERSDFLQSTFGRYVSEEVVAMLIATPSKLRLGGENQVVTTLMTDLRGFTALCERYRPEEVVGILNQYLGAMADLVIRYQGTVDSFIGDAVMAIFGSPLTRDDDALRAVACAVEMQQALVELNRGFLEQDLPALEMGIGINTGEVIAGNLGSVRRSHFGVIGASVNVAARIESYTVGGQVLISESTLAEAGELVAVGDPVTIAGKGLKTPVAAYPVLGVGPPYNLAMPEVKEDLVDLPQPVAVRFVILSGKKVGDDDRPGVFVRLSNLGAEMACAAALEPLVNLKLTVLDAGGQELEGDVYAKVVERETAEAIYPLRFTWTPPAIKKHLEALRAEKPAPD